MPCFRTIGEHIRIKQGSKSSKLIAMFHRFHSQDKESTHQNIVLISLTLA